MIFKHYNGSFGSSSNHFTYLMKGVWSSLNGSTCCPHLFRMLGFDRSYICHLFPTRWSPYSSQCNGTFGNWYFPLPCNITRYPSFTTLGCLFSCPPFWKCCTIQLYLHLHVIFMDHLHNQKFATLLVDAPWNVTQAHFQSCASLIMNVWLLTRPITPTFCLSSIHILITLCTCLGLLYPIVAHFSHCQCGHTIDDLCIHLCLKCLCKNEHITPVILFKILSQLLLWRLEHIYQIEVSHLFPYHIWRQVNILITKDNFWTLMDVVIAYHTHLNMV